MEEKGTDSSTLNHEIESLLDGENAEYLDALFERYLQNPASVPHDWLELFRQLPVSADLRNGIGQADIRQQFRSLELFNTKTNGIKECVPTSVIEIERQQVKVLQLINTYRFLGHLVADTNPLVDLHGKPTLDELSLPYYQLDQADKDHEFDPGDFHLQAKPTLANIYRALRNTYTGSIGAEYMHIMDTEEKSWLQHRLESCESRDEFSTTEKLEIFHQLSGAETFEQYLHKRYIGQKRFGLEGGESLIPLIQTLIHDAAKRDVKEIAIGMAHRGRLNVLVNVMGKPAGELFKEFEGTSGNDEYAGDVKYHKGSATDIKTAAGPIHVSLAFNPSHLEIVTPVVLGHVRARRDRRNAHKDDPVLGIAIHGDAAFAGQGVVMETLNMAQTRGYTVQGTIHIVINNQIGFTTSTSIDSRSSYYPTDVAKMVNAPILHVNGDDPEAVVFAARVALEYRLRFQKDIVIDLVCYRRRGHNEADEPSITQPLMYEAIRGMPTTLEKYVNRLIETGILSSQAVKRKITKYREKLVNGDSIVDIQEHNSIPEEFQAQWLPYTKHHWTDVADTRFDHDHLIRLARICLDVPKHIVLHERVKKVLQQREKMINGEQPVDWGFAENMAYATLLVEGFDVRLSGQDSGRGTFSHRHAVLHNQGECINWKPLQHLAPEQGRFTIIDSLLSEEAVLAFEYGYATADPKALVIWEAQFGDFANNAQVVIDQFISSGEQKWGRLSDLTLFLPHGYEGMGAEHSSARLERFLQLCAQHNMQVCIPSTPAQIFHLLRRQMIRSYRKPLIVMTPKSLLRHPLATNTLEELSQGEFQLVIDDKACTDKQHVTRITICSGKIVYDLYEARQNKQIKDTAIVRIEQLYPFPEAVLQKILALYENLQEIVWCQEEPLNQGAWDYLKHRLHECAGDLDVICVSRPSAAAPAVGSLRIHRQQQQSIVEQALRLSSLARKNPDDH
jgi:2-oxoglutarate dehydrogenase E1 component